MTIVVTNANFTPGAYFPALFSNSVYLKAVMAGGTRLNYYYGTYIAIYLRGPGVSYNPMGFAINDTKAFLEVITPDGGRWPVTLPAGMTVGSGSQHTFVIQYDASTASLTFFVDGIAVAIADGHDNAYVLRNAVDAYTNGFYQSPGAGTGISFEIGTGIYYAPQPPPPPTLFWTALHGTAET